jgi:hypothetical protein
MDLSGIIKCNTFSVVPSIKCSVPFKFKNRLGQGTLTEGEGSVQHTSYIKVAYFVINISNIFNFKMRSS